MPRTTMPLLAAKQMAQALLPHTATDNVTPVLMGAVLGGERFGQYAFASDRYTIGRYDMTNLLSVEPEEELWIPREALAILRTLGSKTLLWGDHPTAYEVTFATMKQDGKYWVTEVTVDYVIEGQPPITHWFRTFAARGADGNFPPTHRLIEEFIPGELMRVGLGYEHLTKFAPLERTGQPIRLTMPKASTTNKLAPILVESGERFKGLIQPNLMFEGNGVTGFGPDLAMENLAKEKEREAKAPKEQATTEGGE